MGRPIRKLKKTKFMPERRALFEERANVRDVMSSEAFTFATAGVEPSLSDMAADPVFQMILLRDGLAQSDVMNQLEEVKRRLAERI